MKVKFWGVRGSIPCPGGKTVKYGGNTACIEVRFPGLDRVVIIDAGSGIRELGNHIMSHDLPAKGIDLDIFLSHTHWDHIMGFPFFIPIYVPGTKIRVHGPVNYESDPLEKVVGGQMTYRYFPVRGEELAAQIDYFHLKEERIELGDGIVVTTKYLNHPIICLGYRIEYQGKVFCTAYDTEPFVNIFCTDPNDPSFDEALAMEGDIVAKEQNDVLEDFISDADLLVYDAQYSRKEYEESKLGWGHTPIEYAIESSTRAGVKKLSLFHHDPLRSDEQLDELSEIYCDPDSAEGPERFFAREGLEIVL